MNVPIKPFDVLFLFVAVLFFVLKPYKLQYFQSLNLVNYPIFAFITISLLSVMGSTTMSTGITYFIHTVYMVFIFYFIAVLIRSERELKTIIWGYTCSVLISTLFVIAELSGFIVNMGTLFQGTRAQGFFIDPNDFSPFLILAILFLLENAFRHHCFSTKHLLFICLAFLVIFVLLASMSRAAFFNAGITLLIYLFYTVRYKKRFGHITFLLFMLIAGGALVFFFFGDSILNQLSLRFNNSTDGILQNYDSDRFYYQLKGLILGFTHLLGIGPGQFEILHGYATHNLYIRVIAENGWIAFLFFITAVLYVLYQLYRNRKEDVWGFPIYLFFAVYVGVLLNSLFLDTLHWRYFWFLLGIFCVLLKQIEKKTLKHETRGTRGQVLICTPIVRYN